MNIRYNKYLEQILHSNDENKECEASLESKLEDCDSYIISYKSRLKEFYKPILTSKFPSAVNIN